MRATLLELVHVQPNMLFLELHLKTIFFSPGSYMFNLFLDNLSLIVAGVDFSII